MIGNSPKQLKGKKKKKNQPKQNILALVTDLGDVYQPGDRKRHLFPPSPPHPQLLHGGGAAWHLVARAVAQSPPPVFPEGPDQH